MQGPIILGLSCFLANTYILYLKTQNFHWNVVDPRFYSLHKFFEEQYENLAEAVDEIAERIRMIGGIAPGTMSEFLQLTTLKEGDSTLGGDAMLHQLLSDHEVLIRQCHHLIEQGTEAGDDGSADLCIQRVRYHEKTAWMIRSHFIR